MSLIGAWLLIGSAWASAWSVRDDARCIDADALWVSLGEALGDRVLRRLDAVEVELTAIESSILVSVVVRWRYERWFDTEFVVAAECEHVDELIVRSIERGTEDWAVRPARPARPGEVRLEPSLALAPSVGLGPGATQAPRGHLAARYALGTPAVSWTTDLRVSAGAPMSLGVDSQDPDTLEWKPAWAGYAAAQAGSGVQFRTVTPWIHARLGVLAGPALTWSVHLPVTRAVVIPAVTVSPGLVFDAATWWQVALQVDAEVIGHRLVTEVARTEPSDVAVPFPRSQLLAGAVFRLGPRS